MKLKVDIFSAQGAEIKEIANANGYLPFVSVKDILVSMQVGDIIAWPMKKAVQVKISVSELNKESEMNFRTMVCKAEKQFRVCRMY